LITAVQIGAYDYSKSAVWSDFCHLDSDNEYTQIPGTSEYFAELEDAFRSSGIIVPLTYNDPGAKKNFVNGTVKLLYPALIRC
jgi:hypothetical protein